MSLRLATNLTLRGKAKKVRTKFGKDEKRRRIKFIYN